jgi:hypothetical protein
MVSTGLKRGKGRVKSVEEGGGARMEQEELVS